MDRKDALNEREPIKRVSKQRFLIDLERVQDACYYVFVVLNKPDVPPDLHRAGL